jgi:Glycosyltransferase family 43
MTVRNVIYSNTELAIANWELTRNGWILFALPLVVCARVCVCVCSSFAAGNWTVRLFNQIRKTKRVGVMGVKTSVGPYERCLVDSTTGKVQGFATGYQYNRTYAMDMAGFCFHSRVLAERRPRFRNDSSRGFWETDFIGQLVDSPAELEPLDNCTRLYSWHVRTSAGGVDVNKPGRVGRDPEYKKVLPSV